MSGVNPTRTSSSSARAAVRVVARSGWEARLVGSFATVAARSWWFVRASRVLRSVLWSGSMGRPSPACARVGGRGSRLHQVNLVVVHAYSSPCAVVDVKTTQALRHGDNRFAAVARQSRRIGARSSRR